MEGEPLVSRRKVLKMPVGINAMHCFSLSVTSVLSVSLLALTGLGADPSVPPLQHVGAPLPEHAVTNRAFTGISSIAVAPNGRLWVTWYAGHTPGEDHNNYVVLSTSGDGGATWKEVLIADPDAGGPRRTFDPEVWVAPDGKLRWFFTDRTGGQAKTDVLWMIVLENPAAENSPWQPPAHVADGVMMCKPLVLSNGEWALPVCTWYTEQSSKIVVSPDQGKTWSLRGGATMPKEDRCFDEHLFIERNDGALWCLSRCKSGIREALSNDGGKTWSPLEPSKIRHPSARFFITRLASGNLLLVKHGPVNEKTGRSHLTAYLSKDDGATWAGGLMLDERAGVSYPDGQQTADGTIYLTYDFDRTHTRHILFATFREEDAIAGKPVSGAVRLRQLVSEGSGGVRPTHKPPQPVEANADGEPLAKSPAGTLASEGLQTFTLAHGATLFTDRSYTCHEQPEPLTDIRFLRVPMEGAKTLRCTRSGTVYFLTPVLARNKDSAAQALLDQGFKKARLPEVRLFDPSNPANFCTLYQKSCAEGDTVTIGKWAVPLFFSE